MKKYFIILFLSICCSLSSFAQLPREFLGFKLGVSKKSEVLNSFKGKGYSCEPVPSLNNIYRVVGGLWEYCDIEWPILMVGFQYDTLYEIAFGTNIKTTSSIEEFGEIVDTVDEYLSDNYIEYIDTDYINKKGIFADNVSSDFEIVMYSDKKTSTYYAFDHEKGKESFFVYHVDIFLSSMKWVEENHK